MTQYSVAGTAPSPPFITSYPVYNATEDVQYNYDVEATDPEKEQLTFSLTQAPVGMSIDANTGLISWTPDNSQVGLDSVTVRVEDPGGLFDTQSYNVTVANTNDPPSITSTAVTSATEDAAYSYDVDATDPDVGDMLTYALTVAPTGMSINSSSGLISWTPDNSQVGSNNVTVVATDTSEASDTQAFSITVANTNDPPNITSREVTSATEDVAYSYDVDATDPDAGDVLTYVLTVAPTGMSINSSSGLISWTPDNSQVGSNNVTVEVRDVAGATDEQSYNVTVVNINDPPVVTSTAVTSATEDAAYSYDVEGVDPDIDDTFAFSLSVAPTGMSIDANTGLISWTPDNSQVGSNNVTVEVRDVAGATGSQSFSVTVANTNDVPSITSTPIAGATQGVAYSYDVDATDPDVGDVLTYVLTVAPTGMSINSSSGLISWTPDNSQVGSNNVTVEVRDVAGALATQAFTLVVSNTNDPPQITSVAPTTATEGQPYSYRVEAVDPDQNDMLTFSLDTSPDGMTIQAASGVISWTPDNALVGLHPVVVRVTDLAGLVDSQAFNVAVANVNDPPVILSSAPENATPGVEYAYDLQAQDPDIGDVLTYALDQAPTGMVVDAQTGAVRWTPTNLQAGSHPVQIRVQDRAGVRAQQAYTLVVAQPLPLVADLEILDFGQVRLDQTAERVANLTNPGTGATRVDRVEFSSSLFTLVEPEPPFVLAGGARVALRIEYQAPNSPGAPLAAELVLESDAGELRLGLAAQAVLPGFRISPERLDFGQVSVGEERRLDILLENTGNQDLRFTISTGTAAFILERPFETVRVGESRQIPVLFAPRVGRQEQTTLNIFHALDDVRLIPITGEAVLPGVALTPGSLDFGYVPLGQSRSRRLQVLNTGENPLEFIVISGLNPPFEATASSAGALAPGASRQWDILMTPTGPLQLAGRFEIRTNRGRLEIPLRANSLRLGDFDRNGIVDYPDFFLFADAVGRPAAGGQELYDLDDSGLVDFIDFLLFSSAFTNGRQ